MVSGARRQECTEICRHTRYHVHLFSPEVAPLVSAPGQPRMACAV